MFNVNNFLQATFVCLWTWPHRWEFQLELLFSWINLEYYCFHPMIMSKHKHTFNGFPSVLKNLYIYGILSITGKNLIFDFQPNEFLHELVRRDADDFNGMEKYTFWIIYCEGWARFWLSKNGVRFRFNQLRTIKPIKNETNIKCTHSLDTMNVMTSAK